MNHIKHKKRKNHNKGDYEILFNPLCGKCPVRLKKSPLIIHKTRIA